MQSSQPLVSVVIACYNHEQFVQDAIQSVIDQTYNNIELIIIDDGSKDSSVAKIKEMIELCERRFTRFEFRSRANIGLSTTLNEALEWCQGKYYSPFASDDIMLKDKTATQVSFLEQNDDIAAVFGGVKLIDNNNMELNGRVTEERSYSFKQIIMHEHDLPAPTQMVRLELIKKIGGYDSNLFIEDWYMWLKLSQNGRIFCLSQIFTLYRQHDSNISKNLTKIHQGRFEVLKHFKNEDNYNSAYYNILWANRKELISKSSCAKVIFLIKMFIINPKEFTKKSLFKFRIVFTRNE